MGKTKIAEPEEVVKSLVLRLQQLKFQENQMDSQCFAYCVRLHDSIQEGRTDIAWRLEVQGIEYKHIPAKGGLLIDRVEFNTNKGVIAHGLYYIGRHRLFYASDRLRCKAGQAFINQNKPRGVYYSCLSKLMALLDHHPA